MKELIFEIIDDAKTLPEIRGALIELTSNIKAKGINRIGFVSGIVSSDGLDRIPENMAKLQEYTLLLGYRYPDAAFFSAADVFTTPVYARLAEFQLHKPEIDIVFMEFWRGILESGNISDVSFTPRWRKSLGARDEHDITIEQGFSHQFVMKIKPKLLLVRKCCAV